MKIHQDVVDSAIICTKIVGYPAIVVLLLLLIGVVIYSIRMRIQLNQYEKELKDAQKKLEEEVHE